VADHNAPAIGVTDWPPTAQTTRGNYCLGKKCVRVYIYIFKRNLENVRVLLLRSIQNHYQAVVKFNMESVQFDHTGVNKTSKITQKT